MKMEISCSMVLAALLLLVPATALAQGTEAPAAEGAAASPPPGAFAAGAVRGGGFGAAGQFAISGELQFSVVKPSGGDTTFHIQPALDYFIVPNVSVGGLVGLTVISGDNGSRVTVGGRAGYNLNIAEKVSFWPMAGLYFEHASYGGASNSENFTWLGIFAPFLYHPVQHLFVGVGPFFDLGLSGNAGDVFGLSSIVGGWI